MCIVFGMRNLRFADVRIYVCTHASGKLKQRTTAMELTRQSRLSLPKVHGQRHRGDGHRSGSHHRRHLSPLSSLSCTLRLPWRTPLATPSPGAGGHSRSGRPSAVIGSRRSSKSSSVVSLLEESAPHGSVPSHPRRKWSWLRRL